MKVPVVQRRVRVDRSPERVVLIGMVVSEAVLSSIRGLWDPDLVTVPYVREIGGWCLDHYKQYKKAPGAAVEELYHAAVRAGKVGPEAQPLMERFLAELSEEHQYGAPVNEARVMDLAELMFKRAALTQLRDDLTGFLNGDQLPEAEARVSGFGTPARPISPGFNPFTDREVIFDAFNQSRTPLFTFPGALGYLLNPQLVREGFLGVMGPEKRGKTWWLMEFCFQALMARKNVALFEVGDMSRGQITRRFHIRLAGRSDDPAYCGEVMVPILDCARNQAGQCLNRPDAGPGLSFTEDPPAEGGHPTPRMPLDFLAAAPEGYRACSLCRKEGRPHNGGIFYERRFIEHPLTWQEAVRQGERFAKWARQFRTVVHPSNTLKVSGIDAQLDIWEREEGFTPDVIVVDYADILAPEDARREARHQENEKWVGMRRISQERRALVIAATQTDAESYGLAQVGLRNFSEDKRKYAHVTGMFTLNQIPAEKRAGIMRVAALLLREGEFDPNRNVKVLQCLQIGQPAIASFF